jgi:hypothetical protein
LNPQAGATADPGTDLEVTRDVTKYLCDFMPVCPVLIKTPAAIAPIF